MGPCTPFLSTRAPNMATLGISTNTRLLGLAIIKQGSLADYSIHLHKSSWSASKANKIVTSLEPCMRQYCIKSVVLSIPHVYHQTKEFQELIFRIREYFKAKNIPVCAETPEALYEFCPPGQKKTKKALMNALCLQFPQLVHSFKKEMRNKNKYYYKVFEAVAVAAINDRRN